MTMKMQMIKYSDSNNVESESLDLDQPGISGVQKSPSIEEIN